MDAPRLGGLSVPEGEAVEASAELDRAVGALPLEFGEQKAETILTRSVPRIGPADARYRATAEKARPKGNRAI